MDCRSLTAWEVFYSFGSVLFSLVVLSCLPSARIPTVSEDRLERLLRDEASRILQVTRDKDAASQYRILLSDFPRKDILGVSVGSRRIYISYRLAALAIQDTRYRWLLRQTLAHEIAHEITGHASWNGGTSLHRFAQGRGITGADLGLPRNVRFHPYSVEKELEADLHGMEYWSKLHWDCRIWIKILEGFREQNYSGDMSLRTDDRLRQAVRLCPQADKRIPSVALPVSGS